MERRIPGFRASAAVVLDMRSVSALNADKFLSYLDDLSWSLLSLYLGESFVPAMGQERVMMLFAASLALDSI